jgi:UDP-2,4-diacetamido-2,4,6-trideoxy-beta-L-altropyranose hydrolase
MLIAFRVDATPATGNGHLARCLTLADALTSARARCLFLCRDLPVAAASQVAGRGHMLRSLESGLRTPDLVGPAHAQWLAAGHGRDAQEVAGLLEAERPDWLVVDHYGIDAAWEKRLRPHCRQLMVLDDLADRAHDCDLLLDPGAIPRLEQRYRALVPADCVLMLGSRYALLRPEFDAARAAMPARTRKIPRRVLVMFGGQDEAGQTLEAVAALQASAGATDFTVDVLIPEINCRRSEIAQACAADERFRLHVASKEVARLMAVADLAIGSGGGATYERLGLQCPSFLTVASENQRAPLQSLADLALLTLYEGRAELEALLRQAFDEGVAPPPDTVRNGVPAVVDALMHRLVCLKPVVARDVARSLRWMQDATLRHEFMLRAAPTRASHFAYWRRLLEDRSQMVYSIFAGQCHVGQAGLRNIEREAGRAELWLYLGQAATRGQGYGEAALARLESVIKNELSCHTAVLHVGRHNTRAIRLYDKAGYQPADYNEQAGFVSAEGVLRMEKAL